MKSFIPLFKPHKAWPGRCLSLFLLVGGLLMAGQVRAQLYSTTYDLNVPALQYLDLATQTWTNKAAPPEAAYDLVTYQGKIYAEAGWSKNFYVYDPVTDTWTANAPKPANTLYSGKMIVAGQNIYYCSTVTNVGITAPKFYRYSPANNTWTQMTDVPNVVIRIIDYTYDGGDYIYCSGFSNTTGYYLLRYSISGNSWSTMPKPTTPANPSYAGLEYKSGKLYFINSANTTFYSLDIATNTYTSLATPLGNDDLLISDGGSYLYSETRINSNAIHRYDIAANTWSNLPTTITSGLVYVAPPCTVTGTVTALQATCANLGGANADAALTLSSYGGGATKVGYSTGSSYTGPDFTTATAVTTAPMTLVNNLANPTVPQPYTIRVFQDATCYKDVAVTLAPTLCLTSDLSLSLSPVTQTGAKGEQLIYTFTLTNAGPDVATGVQVDIKVPTNASLLTASPQLGTYSEATHKWDISSMPVGTKTLTVTLKMN